MAKKTRGPRGAHFLFPPGRLAEARRSAKITQEELAEQAQYTVTTIRVAEAGKRPVSMDAAESIASALGKSLSDFRPDTGRNTPLYDQAITNARSAEGAADTAMRLVRFRHLSQATAVKIASDLSAAEFARWLWGDEKDAAEPPIFRWQHEYMTFAAAFPDARIAQTELAQWFRPFSPYSWSDKRRFPRTIGIKARLGVHCAGDEIRAFEVLEQSERPLETVQTSPRFSLFQRVQPVERSEIKPGESRFIDLDLTLDYRLSRHGFEHAHQDALDNLSASHALRSALVDAADSSSGVQIVMEALFDDGSTYPHTFKLQVPKLPEELTRLIHRDAAPA